MNLSRLTPDSKLLHCMVYVASKGVEDLTERRLYEILFEADATSLERYGRTVTGAEWSATAEGPVPTLLLDAAEEP